MKKEGKNWQHKKSDLLAATIDVSIRSSGQGGSGCQALMPWAMQFPVRGCHGISADRCGSHTIGGMILWFHQFPRDVSFWVQEFKESEAAWWFYIFGGLIWTGVISQCNVAGCTIFFVVDAPHSTCGSLTLAGCFLFVVEDQSPSE